MKRIGKFNIKYVILGLGLVVIAFLVQCALVLNGVDVPSSGTANQVSTFTMHCGVQPRITGDPYSTKLVIGFLVPKSWHAAQNTNVSFTSPIGGETLTVIPASEVEPNSGLPWAEAAKKKLGIGGNLVDDVEWVMFRSSNVYTLVNNQDFNFDVVISSKLGPQNMLVKLGFYYGTSHEGLSSSSDDYNKTFFSSCFTVNGGIGDIVDFCNPQLSSVIPVYGSATDNDIITLTYDNTVLSTALQNVTDIYLCATAFTTTGETYNVCEQTAKTKLSDIGGLKYRIDIWPRGFFNIPKGKTIDHIEYYYTDASGIVKVGYSNTSDPFKYTFGCSND
ncbi:MAG: DUF4961 domain-containing protein [Bacteroidota bacterium]|nr:DUF4961 domain-containing protein [Bacteroidota bacterium]MDP4274918.1 DUF4961 domain-containing protein [Bacteroidota bacterium]